MRRTPTPGAVARERLARPQEGCLSRSREPLPTRVEALPPLPSDYDAEVAAGLHALDLDLPPPVRAAVDAHVRLLLAWTRAINLTAVREPAAVARVHVVDSLSAVPLFRERRIDSFVDLGSGGGFPGLPLALVLPVRRALLVDSIRKKAVFLETAVRAVGAADVVEVAAARAETLGRDGRHRERWQAATARAVADLADLVEIALPLVAVGGCLVAWKRVPLGAELAAAEPAVAAVGGGRIELVDPGVPALLSHRLVVIAKARPSPSRFPRDPAERRRRPWAAGG